jgi:vancomycin resistance protein YoaR
MYTRTRLLLIAIPVGLILLVGGVFLVDISHQGDNVFRNTSVGGVALGGLTELEALSVLQTHQDTLSATPIEVSINGDTDTLLPPEVGLSLDLDTALSSALDVGKTGGFFNRLTHWFSSFGGSTEVKLSTEVDYETFTLSMEALSDTLVNEPPFNGGIEIVDGALSAQYPQTGRVLDLADALPNITTSFQQSPRSTVQLKDLVKEPLLTQDHITASIREAQRLLSGPITLQTPDPEKVLTITEAELLEGFIATINLESQRVEISFDDAFLRGLVVPIADDLATEPKDAEMLFLDDGTVEIVPGFPGTTVDIGLLGEALAVAGNRTDRTAKLPVLENAQPEITTESLESLGIKHLVSKFTTYHSPGQDRVVNIQTMAATVDGTIIGPGEVFSLNGVVGQRTREKGYLPAGTIIKGEHVDTVGGGVSQFATTTYNAMFWAGLEDVSHQSHTEYFSRYPEGIEATVNWPELDLKFRNDTENSIMVKTSFEPNSISLYIWGDNDGRFQEGEQSRGSLHTNVVNEGGPMARRVTATVSGRYGYTEPGTRYDENVDILPGEELQVDDGRIGWSVKVIRFIELEGEITEQQWIARYLSAPIVFERHPCFITGELIECPVEETTTTSTAPAST